MSVTLRRADSLEALERVAPEWQRLASEAAPKLPFMTPHWLLPWWRHFSSSRLLLGDRLRGYLFFAPSGELVGVAPMMVSHRPSRGPLQVRQLQLLGPDKNITELNTVLCRPEFEGEVYQSLLDALEVDGGWDWARWWVAAGSPAEAVLAARPRVAFDSERPMFVLQPGASWDTFKSSRSRNIKESLRKGYNSLAREGHRFTFHARASPDELPRALDRFFHLHRRRASMAGTVEHPNWFGEMSSRAFLCEVVYRFAARGQARVFELEIAGEVVASRVGFVVGDALYLYYSGFRAEWGRYSVMTTTTAEAMQWAIREGLQTVNLSFGRDVSKTRWSPNETTFRGAVQVGASARSRYLTRASTELEPRLRAALKLPRLAAVRDFMMRGA